MIRTIINRFKNKAMKLNEITNPGHTYVSFNTDIEDNRVLESDFSPCAGRIIIEFKQCRFSRTGPPSDETIAGHPYYKYGMNSCGFYELESSDLIQSLINVDQIHSRHNLARWKTYKHFILTFHDSIFECVATEFEINNVDIDLYKQEESLFNALSKKFQP